MLARALRPMAHLSLAALLTAVVALTGCQSFLNSRYSDSVHPDQGIVRVKGLAQSVVIRRNALGMPLIETNTFHDALFALGYVHATYKKLLAAGASQDAHFYICGWKNMVDEARATLTELGIPKTQIHFELYG